jgi:hypothetical protein
VVRRPAHDYVVDDQHHDGSLNMPLTSEEVSDRITDRNLNPTIRAGSTVTITLSTNRDIQPEELHEALEAQFGEGKVASDDDQLSGIGGYRFRIRA